MRGTSPAKGRDRPAAQPHPGRRMAAGASTLMVAVALLLGSCASGAFDGRSEPDGEQEPDLQTAESRLQVRQVTREDWEQQAEAFRDCLQQMSFVGAKQCPCYFISDFAEAARLGSNSYRDAGCIDPDSTDVSSRPPPDGGGARPECPDGAECPECPDGAECPECPDGAECPPAWTERYLLEKCWQVQKDPDQVRCDLEVLRGERGKREAE